MAQNSQDGGYLSFVKGIKKNLPFTVKQSLKWQCIFKVENREFSNKKEDAVHYTSSENFLKKKNSFISATEGGG